MGKTVKDRGAKLLALTFCFRLHFPLERAGSFKGDLDERCNSVDHERSQAVPGQYECAKWLRSVVQHALPSGGVWAVAICVLKIGASSQLFVFVGPASGGIESRDSRIKNHHPIGPEVFLDQGCDLRSRRFSSIQHQDAATEVVEPRGIIVKQNGSLFLVLRLGGKLTNNQRGQFKDREGHPIVGIGDVKAENWWSKEIGQARNRCERSSGSLPEAEPDGDKEDDQYIEGGGCGKIEMQVICRKAHQQDYGRSKPRSAEGSKHCA